MVTEKTARKREDASAAAAVAAVKPEIEKIGRGLDYLHVLFQKHNEAVAQWQKGMDLALDTEREIRISDQKNREQVEKELYHAQQSGQSEQKKAIERLNQILASMMIRCDLCGALMSPVQMVCHRCGEISNVFPYEDGEDQMLRNGTEAELRILKECLRSMEKAPAAYPEVQDELTAMQRIAVIAKAYQNMSRTDRRKALFAKIQEEADGFIMRSKNKHIEVAVVGDVKAGKSTLINALLGERMASTDATPETSTLVKYRTTKDKNYARVTFYTTAQWEALWKSTLPKFQKTFRADRADEIKHQYLNRKQEYVEYASLEELRKAIMRWTSKESREHYFVSELEVGYCGELFPNDVVLVDTPGLCDPVGYRSEITKNYIQNANWVVACVPGTEDSISSVKAYEFLNLVRANLQHDTERMIIVATKSDILSPKKRKQLQDHFICNAAEQSGIKEGVVKSLFVYASPYIHLLLDEWIAGKIESTDEEFLMELNGAPLRFGFYNNIKELDAAEMRALREKLGVDTLKDMLDKKVFRSRRKQIQELIRRDYTRTVDVIRSLARENLLVESGNMTHLQEEAGTYYERWNELQRNIDEIKYTQQQVREFLALYKK